MTGRLVPLEAPKRPRARVMGFGSKAWYHGTCHGREVWTNGFVADFRKPTCSKMLAQSLRLGEKRVLNLEKIWPARWSRKPVRPLGMWYWESELQWVVVLQNGAWPIVVDRVYYDYFAWRGNVTFHFTLCGGERRFRPLVVMLDGEVEGLVMPMMVWEHEYEAIREALGLVGMKEAAG